MRTGKVWCLLLSAIVIWLCLPTLAAQKRATAGKPKPKPRLLRVIIYEWALSTGGTEIDFRNGRMENFVRAFRISARLKNRELTALRQKVDDSGLRDFRPRTSDVKQRQPYPDEWPPTLVVIWSDKRRVFQLPLQDTVRGDLATDRRRAYQKMKQICYALGELHHRYSRKPYVSAAPANGREYKAFEEERDRLTR